MLERKLQGKGLTIITRVIELFSFVRKILYSPYLEILLSLGSRLKHLKKKKKKKPTKWKGKGTKLTPFTVVGKISQAEGLANERPG